MKANYGKWLRRGGLVALAMTTIISAGCGGGGGGGSASASNSSGSSGDGSTGGSSTSGTSSATNTPPTISATPAAEVSVGSAYSLAPQASDVDGDALAFSIENKPTWADFNTATGQLTGTPNAASSTPNIVISVSDGKATAALPAFSITVGTTVASAPAPTPTPAPAAPSGSGVALSWNVPTRTVDGETLQNLAGYRIHYGTSQNALVSSIEIQSSGSNSFMVQNLPAGTYYFAVRAIAANGTESKLSNVISRVVS